MRRTPPDLGQHLVRRSVGALADERGACDRCGRTPLTGERVLRYRDGRLRCELCRPLRRVEDARDEVMRHPEHGQTVRIIARAA